jgi:flagellar hook-associated protein 1 FlgK
MSLNSALSIASGALGVIDQQLSLISHNVANASTPDFAQEVATQTSVTADGVGMGVRAGPTQRQIDTQLQASVFTGNSSVTSLQTTSTALSNIDAVLGTPGQGTDLSSLLGNLGDAFSTLLNDPSDQTQQSQVVSTAQSLASGINSLSQAYGTERQDAQNAIVSDVATLNSDLTTIGSLTTQIQNLSAQGQSTADLENQRDAAMQDATSKLGLSFLQQSNGGMIAVTGNGLTIPLNGTTAPFAAQPATIGAGASYPGTPGLAVTLNGVDVTAQLTGGSIGANITLRDSTLPTFQAELDEFSENLATRFNAQGLALFTQPDGSVPASGGTPAQQNYVGFASTIQVNPAVVATPSLVRDGTQDVAGSATGAAAFTTNPAGGPAGFSTLITRVLNNALGSQVQSGVDQPAPAATGLGPAGTLSAPYGQPTTLAAMASALVASQSGIVGDASGDLANAQSLQSTLQSKLSTGSAVSMDTEMSDMITLQNSYGANAKVITAAQSMWTALLDAVTP